MYEVTWHGQGYNAVAHISGPGAELRIRKGYAGDSPVDPEDITEALQAAYAAGASQSASDLDRLGRKIQALEAENTRLNSRINQIILGTAASTENP